MIRTAGKQGLSLLVCSGAQCINNNHKNKNKTKQKQKQKESMVDIHVHVERCGGGILPYSLSRVD
jgi:hypothetical protein